MRGTSLRSGPRGRCPRPLRKQATRRAHKTHHSEMVNTAVRFDRQLVLLAACAHANHRAQLASKTACHHALVKTLRLRHCGSHEAGTRSDCIPLAACTGVQPDRHGLQVVSHNAEHRCSHSLTCQSSNMFASSMTCVAPHHCRARRWQETAPLMGLHFACSRRLLRARAAATPDNDL